MKLPTEPRQHRLRSSTEPLIFVLFGPGGAGKGTIAQRLVANDPTLWLSRSWTTRAPRSGESDDAYVFVDRPTFEARIAAGGFFEWAEFLGNLYGTPVPAPPAGSDVLLEIDLQGAQQVRNQTDEAILVLLRVPSTHVQAERLRRRGDDEVHVQKRLAAGAEEERAGQAIADAIVVNDDLIQATAEVAGILNRYRSAAQPGRATPEYPFEGM